MNDKETYGIELELITTNFSKKMNELNQIGFHPGHNIFFLLIASALRHPKWKFVEFIKIRSNPNLEMPNKYIIVPVGANWTDNTNIIGYHNVITNDYQ